MKNLIKLLFKKYLKKWLLVKPYALSIGGWEDWNTENKKKYPIRYWIQETFAGAIDTWWSVKIAWPIRDFYWKLQHTFNPKHQYNKIIPKTLKPGYYDCDIRILHGIMEEVTTFFETGCNYDEWKNSSDGHQHAFNELERVYNWWKNEWPNREEYTIWGERLPEHPTLPKEWGHLAAINEKYNNTPEVKEYLRIVKIFHESENDWIDMETQMLHRIIDIRKYMWN